MKIISIDPGIESGYCYARITDDKRLLIYPHQGVDDVDELYGKIRNFEPRIIVMEDFESRKQGSGVVLFPVQLIGVARLYTLVEGNCAMYLQKPGEGLGGFYSLNMLKQLGLYKKSLPHGMSATQHLMQWATFKAGAQYFMGATRHFAQLLDEWDGVD